MKSYCEDESRMSVTIRKMTGSEFETFYKWSIEHQAAELMEESNMSREDAIRETVEEVSGMLPDGMDTEHNYLMSIIEVDSGETAGFIWTIHEVTDGRRQSFVCDFAIWESKRRKGYAEAALRLAEAAAAEAGCQESVLFVSDSNEAALALYKKCGYQFLRQQGYGKYMKKQLK